MTREVCLEDSTPITVEKMIAMVIANRRARSVGFKRDIIMGDDGIETITITSRGYTLAVTIYNTKESIEDRTGENEYDVVYGVGVTDRRGREMSLDRYIRAMRSVKYGRPMSVMF